MTSNDRVFVCPRCLRHGYAENYSAFIFDSASTLAISRGERPVPSRPPLCNRDDGDGGADLPRRRCKLAPSSLECCLTTHDSSVIVTPRPLIGHQTLLPSYFCQFIVLSHKLNCDCFLAPGPRIVATWSRRGLTHLCDRRGFSSQGSCVAPKLRSPLLFLFWKEMSLFVSVKGTLAHNTVSSVILPSRTRFPHLINGSN